MRALSIRQPYAEEILRGIKKIEYRSHRTRIIGEPFYIYASKEPGDPERFAQLGVKPGGLPTGVIVGIATISKCTGANGKFEWNLSDVERVAHHRKPTGRPQPIWFNPF